MSEPVDRRLKPRGALVAASRRRAADAGARDRDTSVLTRIQDLSAEEHKLFERESLEHAESSRLAAIETELDQCWDLLRQRRALREYGQNAAQARVRAPEVVKKYSG